VWLFGAALVSWGTTSASETREASPSSDLDAVFAMQDSHDLWVARKTVDLDRVAKLDVRVA
jgi:hypothetical protein